MRNVTFSDHWHLFRNDRKKVSLYRIFHCIERIFIAQFYSSQSESVTKISPFEQQQQKKDRKLMKSNLEEEAILMYYYKIQITMEIHN